MSKLTTKLINFTGFSLTKKPYKYISIDTSKRRAEGFLREEYNYYVQWENKAEFRAWLKENVAKVDQDDWVLFKREEV